MAKKKPKSDIIAEYVAQNPDATWSTASADLERRGIKANYFASQRSKLKAEGAIGEGVAGDAASGNASSASAKKKRGPQKGSKRTSAAGTNSNLIDAVEFARKAGGLDNAQSLLDELARVQVYPA